MKFKSLRQKLLFWFLVFVCSNMVVVFINFTYLEQRERIANVFRLLEQTHGYLLEDYKNQLNFFTQETKNRVFFEFGSSKYIDHHKSLFSKIAENVEALKDDDIIHKFYLDEELAGIRGQLSTYDSLFLAITSLIRERGYKDYSLVGEMRDAAHALEGLKEVSPSSLLTMRRHEKDFMLRHENIYLRKLNNQARAIIEEIEGRRMGVKRSAELTAVVKNYQRLFREVVDLDREIGLYNNSGLKQQLDESEAILSEQFDQILSEAEIGREREFARLKFVTIGVIIVFLLFGVWMSFLISVRITSPLKDLTSYINRFVGSNFTLINKSPDKLTEDEIGKLTLNFNVMRDKIIEQLQFFKEKVEERTAELAEANGRLVKINEANSRFVPNEFLHYLNRESIEEVRLGDFVEQNMTVVFSDIRGFTQFSERMTPQENFDFINDYLQEIVPHVREHNGFVDKYIGDSVMALFANDVDHAIDSAIDSMKSVRRFSQKRKENGLEPIKVGIGIHTGKLILGTIGEENRMETTVISDAVNTASRMEGLTSLYGGNILISGAVLQHIKEPDKYHIRYVDTVMVKGKDKAVRVFEILDGLRQEQFELKQTTDTDFQLAISQYRDKQFDTALKTFRAVSEKNPEDKAAKVYIDRCEQILAEGLPEDWEATQRLTSK